MTTAPQRILPCPEAGPPAGEQGEGDFANKASAAVSRLFDSSALWLDTAVADSNGDVSAQVTPQLSALAKGMAFWYEAVAQNAGPVDFSISNAPPIECKTAEGVSLAGGEFQTGYLYKLVYNGTNLKIHSTIVTSPTTQKAKPLDQQTFLANGTWTKPTGFGAKAYVLIQLWGAGGGGARSQSDSQGSGGAGSCYRELWIKLSDLGATEAVGIGLGGAGRASSAGDGTVGQNSTFGAKLTAYGGGPGRNFNPSSGGGLFSANSASQGNATDVFTGAGATNAGSIGNAVYGGAAGGLSKQTGTSPGGTSMHGGNGGQGGVSPQAGQQPGGGGGAGFNSDGARGGDGKCVVTVFDGI